MSLTSGSTSLKHINQFLSSWNINVGNSFLRSLTVNLINNIFVFSQTRSLMRYLRGTLRVNKQIILWISFLFTGGRLPKHFVRQLANVANQRFSSEFSITKPFPRINNSGKPKVIYMHAWLVNKVYKKILREIYAILRGIWLPSSIIELFK